MSEPEHVDNTLTKMHQNIMARFDAMTPEQAADWERQCEDFEKGYTTQRPDFPKGPLARLDASVGKEYAKCSLSNFQVNASDKQQAETIEKIKKFAGEKDGMNLVNHLGNGGGILFLGPVGTGKDHLMIALMRRFIALTKTYVVLKNGQKMISEIKDTFGKGRETELSYINRMAEIKVLFISDPLRPKGELSEYEASVFYQILEARGKELLPTCVTLNVNDGAEADKRLSSPIFDRLRNKAFVVHCNWPSYRKPREF